MKTLRYLAFAAVIGMTFWGCNDKKDNKNPVGPGNNGGNTTAGTLTATISGSLSISFNSALAVAHTTEDDFDIAGTMMSGSSSYTLSFVISSAPVQSTVNLKDPSDAGDGEGTGGLIISAAEGARSFYSVSGTITVTSATSTRLKGTFQFTATDAGDGSQITVAQGTFDVPIYTGN